MYYIHVYMSIQYMQYASRNLFSPPQSEGGKEPCVLYRENILSQIPPGERRGVIINLSPPPPSPTGHVGKYKKEINSTR